MTLHAETICEHCGRMIIAAGVGRIVSVREVLRKLFRAKELCAYWDIKTGVSKLINKKSEV